jgi:CRP-like cAMP-binding protein
LKRIEDKIETPLSETAFFNRIDCQLDSCRDFDPTVTTYTVQKGRVFELSGQYKESGFYLASGRLTLNTANGHCIWLGPGDLFGFGSWLNINESFSVYADEDSIFTELNEAALAEITNNSPRCVFQIIQILNRQLEEMHTRVGILHGTANDIEVYELMLRMQQKFGKAADDFCTLEIPIEAWAAYFGLSNTTFRRVIKRLEESKLLRRKGYRFKFLHSLENQPTQKVG